MPQRRSHFIAPPSDSPVSSKRAHSPATRTPPSRQSKRLKSSPGTKVTPKKSPYFEHPTLDSEPESDIEDENSGYEDEDASAVSSPPSSGGSDEEAESEEDESESDTKPKKKRGPKSVSKVSGSNTTAVKIGKKGQELWRPGVKSSLAPGEAIYIALPKARSAGSTPYTSSTVHPNTLLFLGDLRQNNDRDWLKTHDADYRASKNDWDSFVDSLTEKIIEKDETIPELPHKDLTFRIYRDIRFSPDPTPYKTHFSAAWSRTGRKGPYAAYYAQIQPKGSFVGAGVWHPEAPPMALIRQDVDRKSHKLKKVLMAPDMRKEFFNNCKPDEGKVVKAFAAMNQENALKTKPKGYDADNPNITLLRLRNYTIGKKLTDEEVLGEKAIGRITELLGILMPFVTYLNSVVMPDEEPDDDDEDDEDDEDGGEEEEEEEDEDEEG